MWSRLVLSENGINLPKVMTDKIVNFVQIFCDRELTKILSLRFYYCDKLVSSCVKPVPVMYLLL